MLIVSGYIHIEPACLQHFMADIKLLAQRVRKGEGNLSYDAAVDDPVTGSVLISERWQDQEALTAHLAATHTRAFITKWEGRMTGEVLKYDAFNERGCWTCNTGCVYYDRRVSHRFYRQLRARNLH